MQLKQSRRTHDAQKIARLAAAELDCLSVDRSLELVFIHYPNDTTKIPEDLITFAVNHEARIDLGYVDSDRVVYVLIPAKKGGFKL